MHEHYCSLNGNLKFEAYCFIAAQRKIFIIFQTLIFFHIIQISQYLGLHKSIFTELEMLSV